MQRFQRRAEGVLLLRGVESRKGPRGEGGKEDERRSTTEREREGGWLRELRNSGRHDLEKSREGGKGRSSVRFKVTTGAPEVGIWKADGRRFRQEGYAVFHTCHPRARYFGVPEFRRAAHTHRWMKLTWRGFRDSLHPLCEMQWTLDNRMQARGRSRTSNVRRALAISDDE